MGRSLNLYAIPDTITHDTSKPICMQWDYERTHDEAKSELHGFLKADETYANSREELDDIDNTWKDNQVKSWDKNYNTVHNQHWCPWCAVFASEGLFESSVLKDSTSFNHSYSNPIWRSDWHFYNMYPGASHTDIVNRFSNERMYRQVFPEDIDRLKVGIRSSGSAYCTADREALEETNMFIEFCEKWLGEPNTAVIYESEI